MTETHTRNMYSATFGPDNQHWSSTPTSNELFLRIQQTYAQTRLNALGYLFLNEVYDMLGIPRTRSGQVVGWSAKTDKQIEFGDLEKVNENGETELHFNVDGIILHLLPR